MAMVMVMGHLRLVLRDMRAKNRRICCAGCKKYVDSTIPGCHFLRCKHERLLES